MVKRGRRGRPGPRHAAQGTPGPAGGVGVGGTGSGWVGGKGAARERGGKGSLEESDLASWGAFRPAGEAGKLVVFAAFVARFARENERGCRSPLGVAMLCGPCFAVFFSFLFVGPFSWWSLSFVPVHSVGVSDPFWAIGRARDRASGGSLFSVPLLLIAPAQCPQEEK